MGPHVGRDCMANAGGTTRPHRAADGARCCEHRRQDLHVAAAEEPPRELSYKELKAFLAVNFPGLEACLLPNATASLLFTQFELDEPIDELFPSVAHSSKAELLSLKLMLKNFPAARAAASAAEIELEEARTEWNKRFRLKVQELLERDRKIAALRTQLGAVEQKRLAAQEAVGAAQQAAVAAQEAARRQVEAAQRAASEAADGECERRVREMSEQLEAMRVSMEAEAARADTAEHHLSEAQAKLARLNEADVQAAVSFMLAPGQVMAAAAKERAAAWATALEMPSSCVM